MAKKAILQLLLLGAFGHSAAVSLPFALVAEGGPYCPDDVYLRAASRERWRPHNLRMAEGRRHHAGGGVCRRYVDIFADTQWGSCAAPIYEPQFQRFVTAVEKAGFSDRLKLVHELFEQWTEESEARAHSLSPFDEQEQAIEEATPSRIDRLVLHLSRDARRRRWGSSEREASSPAMSNFTEQELTVLRQLWEEHWLGASQLFVRKIEC